MFVGQHENKFLPMWLLPDKRLIFTGLYQNIFSLKTYKILPIITEHMFKAENDFFVRIP